MDSDLEHTVKDKEVEYFAVLLAESKTDSIAPPKQQAGAEDRGSKVLVKHYQERNQHLQQVLQPTF